MKKPSSVDPSLAIEKAYQFDQYSVGLNKSYTGILGIKDEQIPTKDLRKTMIALDLCCIEFYKKQKSSTTRTEVIEFKKWLSSPEGVHMYNSVLPLVDKKLKENLSSKVLSKCYTKKQKNLL